VGLADSARGGRAYEDRGVPDMVYTKRRKVSLLDKSAIRDKQLYT